jgi:hypothetical protein
MSSSFFDSLSPIDLLEEAKPNGILCGPTIFFIRLRADPVGALSPMVLPFLLPLGLARTVGLKLCTRRNGWLARTCWHGTGYSLICNL